MRNSKGSQSLDIDKLMEIFDEDYLLQNCKLDDEDRFDPTDMQADSYDFEVYQ